MRPRSQLVDGMAEAEPGTTEEVGEVGEEPVEVAETRRNLKTNVNLLDQALARDLGWARRQACRQAAWHD